MLNLFSDILNIISFHFNNILRNFSFKLLLFIIFRKPSFLEINNFQGDVP